MKRLLRIGMDAEVGQTKVKKICEMPLDALDVTIYSIGIVFKHRHLPNTGIDAPSRGM